jgi:hypothetical protein
MIAAAKPAIKPLMREDFRVMDAMSEPRIVPKIHELRNSCKLNPLFK